MNVDDPTLFWNAPQDDQGRAARPVLLSLHDAQQDEGCARLAYFRIVTRLSQQHMPAPQARSAAFIAIHEFQEAVLAVALKGAYVAPDGYLLWDPTFTFKGLDVTDPRVAPLLLRAKALLELMGGSWTDSLDQRGNSTGLQPALTPRDPMWESEEAFLSRHGIVLVCPDEDHDDGDQAILDDMAILRILWFPTSWDLCVISKAARAVLKEAPFIQRDEMTELLLAMGRSAVQRCILTGERPRSLVPHSCLDMLWDVGLARDGAKFLFGHRTEHTPDPMTIPIQDLMDDLDDITVTPSEDEEPLDPLVSVETTTRLAQEFQDIHPKYIEALGHLSEFGFDEEAFLLGMGSDIETIVQVFQRMSFPIQHWAPLLSTWTRRRNQVLTIKKTAQPRFILPNGNLTDSDIPPTVAEAAVDVDFTPLQETVAQRIPRWLHLRSSTDIKESSLLINRTQKDGTRPAMERGIYAATHRPGHEAPSIPGQEPNTRMTWDQARAQVDATVDKYFSTTPRAATTGPLDAPHDPPRPLVSSRASSDLRGVSSQKASAPKLVQAMARTREQIDAPPPMDGDARKAPTLSLHNILYILPYSSSALFRICGFVP